MMIKQHSAVGTAAYLDLRLLLQDEAVSQIQGTLERKEMRGRAYWYDRYRMGQKVVSRYIGEDTEELRARLQRATEMREGQKERAPQRSRLVRILRAEGYAGLDATTGSLLTSFARAGLFRLGGTIVGTVAFRLYEGELGVRLGFDAMAQTLDIDIASFERLSLALGDKVTENLGEALKGLSFDPVPSLDGRKVWRWREARGEAMVEFLTPSFDADEGLRDLPALGVSAQALHHLNYLIADPIPAVALYRSGILVQIPRPERFAIHKLIVADRRRDGTDSLKARKDRAQAAFLVEALADERPDELAEAYEDALSRGPKWKQRIEASLARMPETKDRLKQVTAG
ncbi:nucleotidyltransferase family protein [Psychromarinibacter sp. S121]|uniref:nucleotidyltransferase family protein n=1 Tax=Psychromarinibacter sp. S121 TaxID=3415127 RepID=UPI003C7A4286